MPEARFPRIHNTGNWVSEKPSCPQSGEQGIERRAGDMEDAQRRLDGNAAVGSLREVSSSEVTTAAYACEGCGRTDRIGGAMVYEVRGLGTIVRCPSCDNALIRLARHRGRYRIDLRGVRHLQLEEEVAG